MLPARRFWSAAECELLRQHYAHTLTEDLAAALGRPVGSLHRKASLMGQRKSAALVAQMARERSSDPAHGGRATLFKKGLVPFNKGKKMPAGWGGDAMAQTQFKPGARPHTWRPVGSYTVNPDGTLDRKVSDAPGPRHRRWHPVHRLVWEAAHGPVPQGMVVAFKPGRRTAELALITLDAVELVSRAELMQRNSFHNWPAPLAEVVRLRALLSRQINQAQPTDQPNQPTDQGRRRADKHEQEHQ